MKTHPVSRNNRFFSLIRAITAIALLSAGAATAFVASGDRIFTVSSPPRQLSHDRLVISKIAGERDAESTSARTTPGEGPIGGYEAYKSATRTYPANVIPVSMVQNAKKTFNKIATQSAASSSNTLTGNNHWQSYGPIQNSVQPGVLSFSGATTPTSRRDTALVIAPTCVPCNCGCGVGTTESQRFEPGANPVGVYESTDGGATFTEVWNGNGSTFGVTDVGLDPQDPTTVYASAFDQGVWRRSPSLDGTSSPTAFKQVFAPQFAAGAGVDRTMFALTVKNTKTRIYLTDGTAASSNPLAANAANFWRTDNAGQTAAALLASQAAGSTVPPDTTVGPQAYNGWQKLSSNTTASPHVATVTLGTGQCRYDEEVSTPAGLHDTA